MCRKIRILLEETSKGRGKLAFPRHDEQPSVCSPTLTETISKAQKRKRRKNATQKKADNAQRLIDALGIDRTVQSTLEVNRINKTFNFFNKFCGEIEQAVANVEVGLLRKLLDDYESQLPNDYDKDVYFVLIRHLMDDVSRIYALLCLRADNTQQISTELEDAILNGRGRSAEQIRKCLMRYEVQVQYLTDPSDKVIEMRDMVLELLRYHDVQINEICMTVQIERCESMKDEFIALMKDDRIMYAMDDKIRKNNKIKLPKIELFDHEINNPFRETLSDYNKDRNQKWAAHWQANEKMRIHYEGTVFCETSAIRQYFLYDARDSELEQRTSHMNFNIITAASRDKNVGVVAARTRLAMKQQGIPNIPFVWANMPLHQIKSIIWQTGRYNADARKIKRMNRAIACNGNRFPNTRQGWEIFHGNGPKLSSLCQMEQHGDKIIVMDINGSNTMKYEIQVVDPKLSLHEVEKECYQFIPSHYWRCANYFYSGLVQIKKNLGKPYPRRPRPPQKTTNTHVPTNDKKKKKRKQKKRKRKSQIN